MDSNIKIKTKNDVENLWRQCFNDSPDFIDFYFQYRYNDDINIGVSKEDKMISALQMIPYPMTFAGQVIPISYISGACTDNKYRNKGVMRQLLSMTHKKMYSDGVLLSTLIPAEKWLVGYYQKSGYSECFSFSNEILNCDFSISSDNISIDKSLKYTDEVFTYFYNNMQKRKCCILHNKEDFKVIMADLELENGNLFIARENGEIKGLAFVLTYLDKLYFKELLYDNEIVKQLLVNSICINYNFKTLELSIPVVSDVIHKGMARIINVERILTIYASYKYDVTLYLEVYDDAIEDNNGFFIISKGVCERKKIEGIEYKKCSIKELTSMLLSLEYPFMSLMLD